MKHVGTQTDDVGSREGPAGDNPQSDGRPDGRIDPVVDNHR